MLRQLAGVIDLLKTLSGDGSTGLIHAGVLT
jgi:hypothetical protein